MGCKVAVVGATDTVGREVLSILAERAFPADEVVALAASGATGREVSYGEDDVLAVKGLDAYDFTGTDLAVFAAGSRVSAKHVPRATAAGCVVIDATAQFRMEPGVPLVVPEVNAAALAMVDRKRIVANPTGLAIQTALTLKPLHDALRVQRVVVSTYQSTAGAGREAMDELFAQTRNIYVNEPPSKTMEQFPKQIAFNVIPQVDSFLDGGATREEGSLAAEARKVLDPDIRLHANCVRVPVFIGDGAFLNIAFEDMAEVETVRALLRKAPGVTVVDHRADEGYVTPVECVGEDSIYISRIRRDETVDSGVSLWCVADTLRKGSALNIVQIAEILVADHL
jgi:aspartate-semialdehyde dehydrogenase